MKVGIQNSQAEQKNVKTIGKAERAFTCNIILPDFAIFVLGITSGFITLLTILS